MLLKALSVPYTPIPAHMHKVIKAEHRPAVHEERPAVGLCPGVDVVQDVEKGEGGGNAVVRPDHHVVVSHRPGFATLALKTFT